MATHCDNPIPHLVVDSAAFLKRARLETFGSRIYTTADVIGELRDPQIRAHLKSLPYTLHLQVPSKESIQQVTEMCKKTGDYSVLSNTDIGLMAVTYELHKQHVGEPICKPVVPLPANLGAQAQLVTCPTTDASSEASSEDASDSENEHEEGDISTQEEPSDLPEPDEWITEHNFEQKAASNFGLGEQSCSEHPPTDNTATPLVACLTTDFAMQNVLFHLGLDLVGLHGFRITRPRTYLLWCGSCFRPTKRTDTYFCPSCAQANLRRIPVTLMEDGRLQFHFARRFVKSLRGSNHPVRRPRGGKHADEPIYCPDQRLPDRRPAKAKNSNVQPIATNGMLDELSELDELFQQMDSADYSAFPLHDVTSRSARLGIRSDHQIAKRRWNLTTVEHGLKPSRSTSHLSKPRTGNKKKKRQTKM